MLSKLALPAEHRVHLVRRGKPIFRRRPLRLEQRRIEPSRLHQERIGLGSRSRKLVSLHPAMAPMSCGPPNRTSAERNETRLGKECQAAAGVPPPFGPFSQSHQPATCCRFDSFVLLRNPNSGLVDKN